MRGPAAEDKSLYVASASLAVAAEPSAAAATPRRRSDATCSAMSATRGEITTVTPGRSSAVSWKHSDLPPPVGSSSSASPPPSNRRMTASKAGLRFGGCSDMADDPSSSGRPGTSATQRYDIGLPASARTLPPRPMKQTPAARSIQCRTRWKRRWIGCEDERSMAKAELGDHYASKVLRTLTRSAFDLKLF